MSTHGITNGTERAIIENMLDRNREALIETTRAYPMPMPAVDSSRR